MGLGVLDSRDRHSGLAISGVQDYLLTATCEHLHDPNHKVYCLSMYGEMFEANVYTLETKFLFDLGKELAIPTERLEQRDRSKFGNGAA